MKKITTGCVINSKGFYKEFVAINPDGSICGYTLKRGEKLLHGAQCPCWAHGTNIKVKWLGGSWDESNKYVE